MKRFKHFSGDETMSLYEPINKVALELGLTSRTLRHWEDEGLFESLRDPQSGWRTYDGTALGRVRFTLLMRQLDIPVRHIKSILESGNPHTAVAVLTERIDRLNGEGEGLARRKALLCTCLTALKSLGEPQQSPQPLALMETTLAQKITSSQNLNKNWEASIMSNNTASSGSFRTITLPAMRVAMCNIISSSPEDEALKRVLGWAEAEGIMGTVRIFGFNTTAYAPGAAEYGWAACVTVPEQTVLPAGLEEKRLPGGLYAMLASTNEIYDSWQALVATIKESEEVEADCTRPCLEEHIRNGNPMGSGNAFYLNLLEPVRRK
jgi:DNA-binding transcriptional MerR regulator/DNA gyrase inhibitor GyrI